MIHPTAAGSLTASRPTDQRPKGRSRFTVLYHKTSGTKKEKQWREGSLTVSFDAAVLYCTETNTCVTVLKGSGLMPNRVYQAMEKARRGAAWVAGAELTVGAYTASVEEALELHLIPYDEVVVWGDGQGETKGTELPPPLQDRTTAARPRRPLLHTAPPPLPLPPHMRHDEEEEELEQAAVPETNYSWAATCVAPPHEKLRPPPPPPLPPPQGRQKRQRSRSEVLTELQECFPWL